jgi:uncharacterized membrane protein HdeD (DUF308 family)
LLAGVIGVFAGIATLSRGYLGGVIARDVMLSVLGVVILLTGILHAFGGFQVGDDKHRKISPSSLILGLFEMVLGLLLIVQPLGRSNFFYFVVSIWAFVGGFILLSDAVRLYRASKLVDKITQADADFEHLEDDHK